MNKVKLLSATAMLVAALAAPGFAQDRGGGGSAGARAAVSGGASQGRSFGGSAGAPSARGEFSGGGMRTGSAQIGAGGTVRGGSDRTFATNRGDWRGGHHRHGGRFVVGGYNSYAYGDCYVVRKRVLTPYGWRVRRAQVCN